MMGHTDFKASNGWLDGFKSRHNISYKTVVGEAGLVDSSVVSTWLKDIMPKLIEKYELRDIFNADESGLFYKATPNKTMIYKNMAANSVKVEKERLTLLFCANADRSEKMFQISEQSKSPCLLSKQRQSMDD